MATMIYITFHSKSSRLSPTKWKMIFICFILVFALTTQAYGMGWRPECIILGKTCSNGGSVQGPSSNNGNNNGGNNSGGSNSGGTNAGNNIGNNGGNGNNVIVSGGNDNTSQSSNNTSTAVPEPTIALLLGAGLIGLFGFRKKLGR